MRIATRLWLALIASIVLVLSVGVTFRVREERRVLLEVTLRNRRFFAHALRAALTRGGQDADPVAEAERMLGEAAVVRGHIESHLVSRLGRGGLPRPLLGPAADEGLARGDVVAGVRGAELLTYVPLDPQGRLAVELVEPHAMEALLAPIRLISVVGQTVAISAFAGLLTFALVGWFVGRPLARLAQLARRIAAGDLEARVALDLGRDEVGLLAREMNQMAFTLSATRREVEELDAARVEALEQLRHADRLRTVGQLASSLAHELGTPLNVVGGHARMIEQEPGDSEARASARVILEQADRMARILRSLLDIARRGTPIRRSHDLRQLAEGASSMLAPLARRHQVAIELVEPPTPVSVRADAQQILQVITNLLMNAFQASPGGGAVSVCVEERDVIPPTGVHAPSGRYACVSVEDHGQGIAEEDLPRLFEPFFTRKGEGEGTGLGLAVVEGIVRDHLGWVTVSSERGKGSRFEVCLPLEPN